VNADLRTRLSKVLGGNRAWIELNRATAALTGTADPIEVSNVVAGLSLIFATATSLEGVAVSAFLNELHSTLYRIGRRLEQEAAQ
jgi:hypothetical protein